MTDIEFVNRAYSELHRAGVVGTKKDFAEILDRQYTNVVAAMKGNERYLNDSFIGLVSKALVRYNIVIDETDSFRSDSDTRELIEKAMKHPDVIPPSLAKFNLVWFKDLSTSYGKLWSGTEIDLVGEKDIRVIAPEFNDVSYMVVKVDGHAMDDGSKRSICDGDELLIKRFLGTYEAMPIRRKLFVINTIDGSVVRQIVSIDTKEGEITLRAFNEQHEDYTVKISDLIEIFTVEKRLCSDIVF